MDEAKAMQARASSITLEEFIEISSRSVLRAIQEQTKPNEPWQFGPIICGFIFNPPEGLNKGGIEVQPPIK